MEKTPSSYRSWQNDHVTIVMDFGDSHSLTNKQSTIGYSTCQTSSIFKNIKCSEWECETEGTLNLFPSLMRFSVWMVECQILCFVFFFLGFYFQRWKTHNPPSFLSFFSSRVNGVDKFCAIAVLALFWRNLVKVIIEQIHY